MSTDPSTILICNNLTKKYYYTATFKKSAFSFFTGYSKKSTEEINAVSKVSLELIKGDVLGIIGRNGAGKSTLLKLIAGVIKPTTGSVELIGSASAILELGSGIDMNLSGLDNIYLGCLCRGMKPSDIKSVTPWIEEFSELGDALNRQICTYSSGMLARLLFSIAIAKDSSLLIIDEAIAAGDILFQEKCIREIRRRARMGTSIILVTHGIDLVPQICTRAIVLHKGGMLFDGDTSGAVKCFYDLLAKERNPISDNYSPTSISYTNQSASSEFKSIAFNTKACLTKPEKGREILDSSEEDRKAIDAIHNKLASTYTKANPASHSKPIIGAWLLTNALGQSITEFEYDSDFFVSYLVSGSNFGSRIIAGVEIRNMTGLTLYSHQNVLSDIEILANNYTIVTWKFKNSLQNGYYYIGIGVGELEQSEMLPSKSNFNVSDLRLNLCTLKSSGAGVFGGLMDLAPLFVVSKG